MMPYKQSYELTSYVLNLFFSPATISYFLINLLNFRVIPISCWRHWSDFYMYEKISISILILMSNVTH